MCWQEVYLKNSEDSELVRRGLKGLNWKGIIKCPCAVSSLNEALLRIFRDRVPKQIIVGETGDRPWFDDRCVLAHHAKQREYRVWSRSWTQADWEEYRMARRQAQPVCEDTKRAFTEPSKSLLTKAPNQRKW